MDDLDEGIVESLAAHVYGNLINNRSISGLEHQKMQKQIRYYVAALKACGDKLANRYFQLSSTYAEQLEVPDNIKNQITILEGIISGLDDRQVEALKQVLNQKAEAQNAKLVAKSRQLASTQEVCMGIRKGAIEKLENYQVNLKHLS
ncbi:hypothetical protein ACFLZX_00930 [Nanoarchaeota archaeon]